MKRFNILIVFLLLINLCSAQEIKEIEVSKAEISKDYSIFGEKIALNGTISSDDMLIKYNKMSVADTIQVKFTGTVTEVCKSKGCWMKLQLKDGLETMVKFKNYGFFMPKDIEGKEVIVNGLAFVSKMNIETQKHYAKDAGKSEKEIAEINKPKNTYSFEANGVLLKK